MVDTQPEGPVPHGGEDDDREENREVAPGHQADPAPKLVAVGGAADPIAGYAGDDDRLTVALDHLADSAEKTSAEQQVIADSARAMTEERRRGRSWAAILAGEGEPSVLALLGSSLRRLSQTSSRVRTAVAAALVKEGLSTRQIASHLGVTHQRVSAMLNRPKS